MNSVIHIIKEDISTFQCPPKIKLHEKYSYFIFDQKHNLSCSTASAISLIEYLRQKEGKKFEKLSVGFLYYQGLKTEGITKNAGIKASSVILALIKSGACSQEKWSSAHSPLLEPSNDAVLEALSRIKNCNIEYIDITIETIKYILGFCERPIVAIFNIYDTEKFYNKETSYDIVNPPDDPLDESEKHSILLVGYDDEKRVIYFQNSYGDDWGKGGFGRISYDYVPFFSLLYSMDESCIKSDGTDDDYLELNTDS